MSGYGGGYEYNAGGGGDANNGGFFAYNNGAQMGNNAGGGFITSPNGGGGDMASPGTARQTREKQSMMPLTIKQVLGAQHATPDDKPKVKTKDDIMCLYASCSLSAMQILLRSVLGVFRVSHLMQFL
jgi:hypothetical protein